MTKVQLYAARERSAEPGVFDYTCMVDGCVFLTGYCTGWQDFDEAAALRDIGLAHLELARQQHKRKIPFRAKYHTAGHPSGALAEECYRQHLLDQHLVLHVTPQVPATPRPCAVPGCDRLTFLWAEMPPGVNLFYLCEDHHNRAGAEAAFPPGSVREIMSSY